MLLVSENGLLVSSKPWDKAQSPDVPDESLMECMHPASADLDGRFGGLQRLKTEGEWEF